MAAAWRRAALAAVLAVCAACAAPAPVTHQVEVHGFRFDPDTLRVGVGDSVVWMNRDMVPHTATGAGWDTGEMVREGRGAWVPREAGAHGYVCAYHPSMTGVVLVR